MERKKRIVLSNCSNNQENDKNMSLMDRNVHGKMVETTKIKPELQGFVEKSQGCSCHARKVKYVN